MEFRVLGPMEVLADGAPIALGGRKQRLVLAVLVLRVGEPVSVATLIDEVWGDRAPDAARNTLQSYVSHLRKVLGDGRIGSAPAGYVLDVERTCIDAFRFESLLGEARAQLNVDPATAAATLGRALALWRGPPFSGLGDERGLAGAIARLEELRLSAQEHRIAAELASGHHSSVIGDLEELTKRYSLRERLWAQLMLALYRSGRQGDALAAYQRARHVLVDELGVDPSPELRQLEQQILQHDPRLRPSTPGTPASGALVLAAPAPGGMFAGYRIERPLGYGATSVVYLAEDVSLGRRVALKVLAPWMAWGADRQERFTRESRAAASLDHPNVVPVYEAGECDGHPFIAMRYVEGTDLRQRLDQVGTLQLAETITVVAQIAAALDDAHGHGLVHRDVKPANVLLATTSRPGSSVVYLSDFGLTTPSADASTGGFVGTLDYAAPEQLEGGVIDGRADQYSLGCVLYECLVGAPPFARSSGAAPARALPGEPPPDVTTSRPELPGAIDAVVARALARAPGARFATCTELADAARTGLALGTDGLPPSSASAPQEGPPRHGQSRRIGRRTPLRLLAVAATLIVTIAAGVAAPRLFGHDQASALMRYGPGMVILDADDGHGVAYIPASAVHQAVEAIYADGSFWVLDLDPLSFVRIDAQSGEILQQIASPIDDPSGFAVDGNDLWIAHYTEPVVSRVDIRRSREVARFEHLPGAGGSGGVTVADGSLWVARRQADDGLGILARLDPDTGQVQHLFHRLVGSNALAYGDDGAIWTAGTYGAVNRIDPQTNAVTSTNIGGRNFYVTAGGGSGWTTDEAKGVVYRLDGDGEIVATYRTGVGARPVAYDQGTAWVGNQDVGTVTAIDAGSGGERTYRFAHPLNAIAAGSGRVLVQLTAGETFDELADQLEGQVARLLTTGYELDPPDPALVTSPYGLQVERATCAGLLRPIDGSPGGDDAVLPEIASGLPTMSADERTYTFSIRPGYAFSPPADGEAVTAETLRLSIERALSPALPGDAPGPATVDDIEGEAAYRRGKAAHISGLRTDGDETLTITLVRPSASFLERLAQPFFCPVPMRTPVQADGGVQVPTGQAGEVTVASAGPYYIARFLNGEYLFLATNPNYSGPRPHRFDAIVVREGIDGDDARALVESGEWDGRIHTLQGGTPLADVLSDRIGCRAELGGGLGLDLEAMCRVPD